MTIKLVTFDLDDTLWDNLPIISEAEADMVQWLQERVPGFQDWYRQFGSSTRSQILEERPQIRYDLNKVRIAVLERILTNGTVEPVAAHELAVSALGIFHGRRNRFLLFDGAEEVLATLGQKYVLASITNGTSDVNKSPLGKYFDISISAAHVLASKPNPSMFMVVLSQSGALPKEAVHVGDHPVDDIECANSVGMHTIQLQIQDRGRKREVSQLATRVVEHLGQVPSVVEELNDV
ncbi:MAG: HAD family hydrolase [Gammaproteobacteria bacterium]|nr:HAD family hydrolase [Gammaproteobacteria bacterium]